MGLPNPFGLIDWIPTPWDVADWMDAASDQETWTPDKSKKSEATPKRKKVANSDGMSKQQIRERATQILEAAGVDPRMIPELVADEQAAAFLVDSPQSASLTAQRFPSPAHLAYGQYVQGFDPLGAPPPGMGMAGFSTTTAPPKGGYQVREDGAIRYNNGVYYDPNTDALIFPPNNPDAQGSAAWFQKVQENWEEDKIESWRKRLNQFGYDVGPSGGWDQTLKTALLDYHQNRYKNFGEPLPLDAAGGKLTRDDFAGALDPAVLKQEVSMWFQEAYGDDPSDDEVEFWTKKLSRKARQVANSKGWDPGVAATVAQARIQNQFRESPNVAEQLEENEEDEMDERIRNSIVSVSQLSSI